MLKTAGTKLHRYMAFRQKSAENSAGIRSLQAPGCEISDVEEEGQIQGMLRPDRGEQRNNRSGSNNWARPCAGLLFLEVFASGGGEFVPNLDGEDAGEEGEGHEEKGPPKPALFG